MSLGECDSENRLGTTGPWYTVLVKPKHEKTVAEALENKGYEAFLPLFLARRQWRSASRDVHLPLFPQYVFCRLNPHCRLPVLEIPSVRAIVSFGRIPIAVDDSEILAVRSMVNSGLAVTPHPFLSAGARIRVTGGPFYGIEGILSTARGQDYLVVSLALLQRSVSVKIERQYIMPLHMPVASVSGKTHRVSAVSGSNLV